MISKKFLKKTEEILDLEKALIKLENIQSSFDYLRINLASPKRIKNWAQRRLPNGEWVGEVKKAETINFRTNQPELDGLFCEKIFGPIKNWKCKCGKYNGFIPDKICEECKVEIIEARVRRYRMGYIELACPVAHLWYFKGVPNYLCILLRCFDENITLSHIDQILYFKEGERFISPENPLSKFFSRQPLSSLPEILSDQTLIDKSDDFNHSNDQLNKDKNEKKKFLHENRVGAEIIKVALESLNLSNQIEKLRSLATSDGLKDFTTSSFMEKKLIRRIRILESFLSTKTEPSWMILTVLPVLPPNLRPLLELESGRLVAADVNEMYRLILNRNQRLFDFLFRYVAPDLITAHGRKLLQEAVDSLIDNARLPKEKIFSLNNKPLKSLTEILEGKQGRFRQSLLGKRVDYSGRSVIVVGPNLRLNQCGLPYQMGVELFQPFLINQLLKTKIKAPSHNTKLANLIIKKNKPFIWVLLSSLMKKYSILLNRAPTLHRFGIQAFDPVLILGQAIHLHPLVCTGFNADFDGDQMAIHLPLYGASQLEAKTLMRPSYNPLSPSNGEVILKPSQDMVMGCYYLTLMIHKNSFVLKKIFSNHQEALLVFYQKKIEIHTSILVRYPVSNFELKVDKGRLILFKKINHFKLEKKELVLHKIFPLFQKKYLVLSNLGILIFEENQEKTISLISLFLETSPGRLLFTLNMQNVLRLSSKLNL